MDIRERKQRIETGEAAHYGVAKTTRPDFGETPYDYREKHMNFETRHLHRDIEQHRLSQQLTYGARLAPHIPPTETRGTLKQVYANVQGTLAGVVLDTPAQKRRVVGLFAAGARGGVSFIPCPAKAIARALRRPTRGPVTYISPKTGNRWSDNA